jgi:hypothetical protein
MRANATVPEFVTIGGRSADPVDDTMFSTS